MPKTDAEIRSDVVRELARDTRVDAASIGVQLGGGLVTLTGTATSYGKKLAAQEAAHRVSGVLDVANEIQVRVPDTMKRSDAAIARAVRDALRSSVFVPEAQIRSTVEDGRVTLRGAVATQHQREEAERAVCQLQGVVGLVNTIRVAPGAADARVNRQAVEEVLERLAPY